MEGIEFKFQSVIAGKILVGHPNGPGIYGATWKSLDRPLSEINPLYFSCRLCGRTTALLASRLGRMDREAAAKWLHEPWCEHPYAK